MITTKQYLCSPERVHVMNLFPTEEGVLISINTKLSNKTRELFIPFNDIQTMVDYLYKLTTNNSRFEVIPELVRHINETYGERILEMHWDKDTSSTIIVTIMMNDNPNWGMNFFTNLDVLKEIYKDLSEICKEQNAE